MGVVRIPDDLEEHIRGFDGRTFHEQLRSWAEQYRTDKVTAEQVEELVEEKIMEATRR